MHKNRRRYFVDGVSCRLGEQSLRIVNLSPGGFFAATDRAPRGGQELEVELELPSREPVHLAGAVRWTSAATRREASLPAGFGVKITRMEPGTETAIQDFLRWSNPLEGPSASW